MAVTISGSANPVAGSVATGDGTTLQFTAAGTAGQLLQSNGASTPTWASSVGATAGGTGQTSYAVGDVLYASTTTALSKLPDVATGNALISGGVGVAPSYGKIGLTTHVSGTLPIANGGTGATTASTAFDAINPMTTTGDLIYEASSGTAARLPVGTTGQVLSVVGGIPAWATGGGGGSGTVTSVGSGTGLTGGPITTSGTLSLATSGVGAGVFGSTTQIPQLNVDTYGRITSATNLSFSSGFTSISVGSTLINSSTTSPTTGQFSLVGGTNVTLSATTQGAITINSTGGSSAATWFSNTTMGGSITVTNPTGSTTSGGRLIIVIVSTSSSSSFNYSLSSGTASFTSTSGGGQNTQIYSCSTGTSVGISTTITLSSLPVYAMAFAYVVSTTTASPSPSSGSSSSTVTSITAPGGSFLNGRIFITSPSSTLNLSTTVPTATGGGPTWTGSGAVHPSTSSLSAAILTATGNWNVGSTTVSLSSNPSMNFWYLTGITLG